MTGPRVRLAESDADLVAVRALCRDYRALLVERAVSFPDIVENYYGKEGYEALLSRLPVLHRRPDGAIYIAELNGSAVGCGMTHRIAAGACEIKRVFVTPSARVQGVASALFGAAMDQARADGFRRMQLDTMIWLTEAIALYARLGFAPCQPFYEADPRFAPYIRFFGRDL